jgi:methyl-accepting chemotaxis protein
MQRLGIVSRLMVVLMMPILAMMGFAAVLLGDGLQRRSRVDNLPSMLTLVTASTSLVHELQKERGSSAGLIAAKGEDIHRQRVNAQRTLSDAALAQYIAAATEAKVRLEGTATMSQRIQRIAPMLEEINSHRQRIDGLTLTVGENLTFYTKRIDDLINVYTDLIIMLDGDSLPQQLMAIRALVMAKERAGLERATGNALVSAPKLDLERWRGFAEISSQQQLLLGDVAHFATPAQRDNGAIRFALEDDAALSPLRTQIRQWAVTGAKPAFDSKEWWDRTTSRIDEIREVENRLLSLASGNAASLRQATDTKLLMTSIIVAGLTLTVGLIGLAISRSITVPMKRIARVVEDISAGKDDAELPEKMSAASEIGQVSNAMAGFAEAMSHRRREEAHNMAREAEAARERDTLLAAMSEKVETATNGGVMIVEENASGVIDACAALRSAFEQSASISANLANSADQISQQVLAGNQRMSTAAASATSMRQAVQELDQTASTIHEVVGLITDIAEQTNLLALNATIEAARAGEHGRGFAVVAQEVKALATQTAQATTIISQRVGEISARSQELRGSGEGIGEAVAALGEALSVIASAAEEQRKATVSFSHIVQEANESVQVMTGEMGAIAASIVDTEQQTGDVIEKASIVHTTARELNSAIPRIVREASEQARMLSSVSEQRAA